MSVTGIEEHYFMSILVAVSMRDARKYCCRNDSHEYCQRGHVAVLLHTEGTARRPAGPVGALLPTSTIRLPPAVGCRPKIEREERYTSQESKTPSKLLLIQRPAPPQALLNPP